MIDTLLRAGLSNLLISLAIAGVAFAVQRRGKHPLLAHVLWLAVLVKLVTPPLVTLPLLTLPSSPSAPIALLEVAPAELPALPTGGTTLPTLASPQAPEPSPRASSLLPGKTSLAWIWLIGSLCVLAASLSRILRFDKLLRAASRPAPPETQALAADLSQRLGLRRVPLVTLAEARLTPLVWFFGRAPRVVLPAALHDELDAASLRWILAHELGHVRRRDHVVRWLEWLACVAFWWNPVAWWARRNLRLNEELCCDALVLGALSPEPREYAGSLLNVAEFLANPTLTTPALASTLDGADSLERRIRMILSDRPLTTASRRARGLVLFCALALLPFGVAQAGEPDYEAVGDRLLKAVAAGELSPDQAEAMMGKLAKVHFAERLAVLEAKGKLKKHKQAWSKKKAWQKQNNKSLAWIPGYLKKIGLDAKQSKQVQAAIKKVTALAKSKAKYPEAYAWVAGYLEKLGLSPEQVKQVEEAMKKAVAITSKDQGHKSSKGDAMGAQFEKLGASGKVVKKFRHALAEAGLKGERQETALGAILKLAHVWRNDPKADHDAFHAQVKSYLVGELDFTGDQVGLVFGLAKRLFVAGGTGKARKIRDHYRKLGIDGSTLEKIAGSLEESGLEGEQVQQALGGIARLLHGQLKPDAPRDELRAGLVKHFKKAGFSGEQIEHMVGLSKKLFPHVKERLARAKEGDPYEDLHEGLLRAYSELGVSKEVLGKVRHALGQFGLDAKQTQGALAEMTRVIYGLKVKGEAYELTPRLRAYFQKELGLSEDQVEQVLTLARKLSALGKH